MPRERPSDTLREGPQQELVGIPLEPEVAQCVEAVGSVRVQECASRVGHHRRSDRLQTAEEAPKEGLNLSGGKPLEPQAEPSDRLVGRRGL